MPIVSFFALTRGIQNKVQMGPGMFLINIPIFDWRKWH